MGPTYSCLYAADIADITTSLFAVGNEEALACVGIVRERLTSLARVAQDLTGLDALHFLLLGQNPGRRTLSVLVQSVRARDGGLVRRVV